MIMKKKKINKKKKKKIIIYYLKLVNLMVLKNIFMIKRISNQNKLVWRNNLQREDYSSPARKILF